MKASVTSGTREKGRCQWALAVGPEGNIPRSRVNHECLAQIIQHAIHGHFYCTVGTNELASDC